MVSPYLIEGEDDQAQTSISLPRARLLSLSVCESYRISGLLTTDFTASGKIVFPCNEQDRKSSVAFGSGAIAANNIILVMSFAATCTQILKFLRNYPATETISIKAVHQTVSVASPLTSTTRASSVLSARISTFHALSSRDTTSMANGCSTSVKPLLLS